MRAPKTVLLVDDDVSVRESLGRVLTKEGYDVLPACSTEEAINLWNGAALDAALLDLNLDGQSGWFLLDEIHRGDASIPVVIITARADQRTSPSGVAPHALMSKPLDLPLLLSTINQLISDRRKAKRSTSVRSGARAQAARTPTSGTTTTAVVVSQHWHRV